MAKIKAKKPASKRSAPGDSRGRPQEQDADQAALGRMPASAAAEVAKRHISRLYRARDDGKLPMVRVGGYWYVAESDLRRWIDGREGAAGQAS